MMKRKTTWQEKLANSKDLPKLAKFGKNPKSWPAGTYIIPAPMEVDEIMKRAGKRTVFYLDELGLINQGLITAHALHLDDREIKCLNEKGAKVVHVPESNMKLCSGVGRIPEMVKMGMTVGLGTDGFIVVAD